MTKQDDLLRNIARCIAKKKQSDLTKCEKYIAAMLCVNCLLEVDGHGGFIVPSNEPIEPE